MVIHFLQRLDPPLFPVLHEILRPKQQAKLKKKQHQREKSDSITIKIENEHENESEIEISENNYELFREKLQNYVIFFRFIFAANTLDKRNLNFNTL